MYVCTLHTQPSLMPNCTVRPAPPFSGMGCIVKGPRLPGLRDPQPADQTDAGVLLVLQRVVLPKNPHLLVGVDGAAHDAAKGVEADAVLRAVHLGGVQHQRTLSRGDGVRWGVVK